MDLILKQKPEDFYVEEILAKEYFEPSEKTICLYKIEKTNCSHKELENILKQKAPKITFHFAGMKDKLATTIQYATANQRVLDFVYAQNNQLIKFTYIRNVKKHLYAGANKENFFIIKTNYFKDYKSIPYIGTPNYFDTQRFGNDIFIDFVKALNNKDYENAIKIYLTRPSLNESINKLRDEIKQKWNHLDTLSEITKEKQFSQNIYKIQILNFLKKQDYKEAFEQLNKKDIKMMIKQYQSFIWNAKLKEHVSNFNNIEYDKLNFNTDRIKQCKIDFDTLKRNAFFYAKELKQERDSKNKELATLSFYLPKGCYATILIKHLFCLNYINSKK